MALSADNIQLLGLQVKVILVNVFGGIVNCATIARGIVNACETIKLTLPVVVRLEGKRHLLPCIRRLAMFANSVND